MATKMKKKKAPARKPAAKKKTVAKRKPIAKCCGTCSTKKPVAKKRKK